MMRPVKAAAAAAAAAEEETRAEEACTSQGRTFNGDIKRHSALEAPLVDPHTKCSTAGSFAKCRSMQPVVPCDGFITLCVETASIRFPRGIFCVVENCLL